MTHEELEESEYRRCENERRRRERQVEISCFALNVLWNSLTLCISVGLFLALYYAVEGLKGFCP